MKWFMKYQYAFLCKMPYTFTLAMMLALAVVWPVKADNGYDLDVQAGLKADDIPMCREMHEIVNLPENKATIAPAYKSKPINIPNEYENFESVKWEPLSINEAEKYFDPTSFHNGLEKIRQDAVRDHVWNGIGDFIFEKARIDFDGTENTVTMLRSRLPNLPEWSCLLGNDAPQSYVDTFNYQKNGLLLVFAGDACTVFTYGKRIYFSSSSGLVLTIFKPIQVSLHGDPVNKMGLINRIMCNLRDTKGLEDFRIKNNIKTGKE